MTAEEKKVRCPLFPLYSTVRHLLAILPGVPKAEFNRMISDIHGQTGTPQQPVDWSDPDSWISERLTGASRQLALDIWMGSDRHVNPRHVYGSYLYINTYSLLDMSPVGVYELTDDGKGLVENTAEVLHRLDEAEGLGELLLILSSQERAKRSDIVPPWSEYLLQVSNFASQSTFRDTLRRRLANLVEREYVGRDGNYYRITPSGSEYSESFRGAADAKQAVTRAISDFNRSKREELKERLGKMSPTLFEHLIGDLLEQMGYEDVEVTKQSGDKGVDVVASVQVGITTVTEVVQVKRHQGSIGRPTLDQLRGALPYFKAIRGTLITLGTFSKGCREGALFPGAAPISLIDREKLLDLLLEHEVGTRRKPAVLVEIDEDYFLDTGEVSAPVGDDVPNPE